MTHQIDAQCADLERLRHALGLANFDKIALTEKVLRLQHVVELIATDKAHDSCSRCLCGWYRGLAAQVLGGITEMPQPPDLRAQAGLSEDAPRFCNCGAGRNGHAASCPRVLDL